jgi:hypothetical protein
MIIITNAIQAPTPRLLPLHRLQIQNLRRQRHARQVRALDRSTVLIVPACPLHVVRAGRKRVEVLEIETRRRRVVRAPAVEGVSQGDEDVFAAGWAAVEEAVARAVDVGFDVGEGGVVCGAREGVAVCYYGVREGRAGWGGEDCGAVLRAEVAVGCCDGPVVELSPVAVDVAGPGLLVAWPV